MEGSYLGAFKWKRLGLEISTRARRASLAKLEVVERTCSHLRAVGLNAY
jgi:hypothetical protein